MGKRKKILMIDQNARSCNFIKDYLNQFGCRVDCASNCDEAIGMLAAQNYDGVLMDQFLNEISENKLTLWLKEQQRREPLIMMNDWADTQILGDLTSQGAVDMIVATQQTGQPGQDLQKAVYGQLLLYATCHKAA